MSIRIITGAWSFLFLAAIVVSLSLLSDACSAEVVRIGGAGAGLGTMKLLGEAFEKKHPGIKVQLFPSLGSSGGIAALSKGRLDIVTSVRPLHPDERASGLAEAPYARTPFVLVTHAGGTKDGLTVRELENIYRGTTGTWPDGTRIRLVLRPETDTDTALLRSISPGFEQALKIAHASKSKILAITDQDCAESVTRAPGALGALTLTQIMTEKRAVKLLAFDGVTPGLSSLSNGTYRLSKTLYLVTGSIPRPAVQRFTDFVYSTEGRTILAGSGNLVSTVSKD